MASDIVINRQRGKPPIWEARTGTNMRFKLRSFQPSQEGPFDCYGYEIRVRGRIMSGVKVDIIGPDGRKVARGVNVRTWNEKTVEDREERRQIKIKFTNGDEPPFADVHVSGPFTSIRTGEDIHTALQILLHPNGNPNHRTDVSLALRTALEKQVFNASLAMLHLANALFDESPEVRINVSAILAIAASKKEDISPALRALQEGLQDENSCVRENCETALELYRR